MTNATPNAREHEQNKNQSQVPEQPESSSCSSSNSNPNPSSLAQKDPVFTQEQAHLTKVYQELLAERDVLTKRMTHDHEQAKKDLAALSSEVRTNLGSDDEEMESYAAIEGLNQLIDSYNQKHDFDAERQKRIDTLLLQPYFAKVVLQMRPNRPPREVYIGSVGITDQKRAPLIIDWRSPVASTYYDQGMGKTSYMVDGKTREVELLLRRQFDIQEQTLKSYFDSDIAIEDSLLLHVLSKTHTEKLKAITATIQREQNEVIRHEDVDAMLVEGIAGSGKTSVMLQRIAYLLYQKRSDMRGSLRADQIGLFAPNTIFEHYINMVLPSLGEQNPKTFTWKSFIAEEGLLSAGEGRETSREDLASIRAHMPKITLLPADLCAIAKGDQLLVKVSAIENALQKFKDIPVGPKLIALMKDELHTRLSARIAQLARAEWLQDKMMELDVEEQMEVFGEVIAPKNDEEILRAAKKFAQALFGSAHQDIEDERWCNYPAITKRLLQKDNPSSVEILYLHTLMSSYEPKPFLYLAIDEAQDFTAAQLECLIACFQHAHFLILGDDHQAIRAGSTNFNEMERLFAQAGKKVWRARLQTSYRSTPEITQTFWSLFQDQEDVSHTALHSVQRAGELPRFTKVDEDDSSAYVNTIGRWVCDVQTKEGLSAIICHHEPLAKWLVKQLISYCNEHGCTRAPQLIDKHQILPHEGIVILTLKHAKGLEFDRVLVADASEASYPSSAQAEALSRRELYTAISRATQNVDIVSQGAFSKLLDAYRKTINQA